MNGTRVGGAHLQKADQIINYSDSSRIQHVSSIVSIFNRNTEFS